VSDTAQGAGNSAKGALGGDKGSAVKGGEEKGATAGPGPNHLGL